MQEEAIYGSSIELGGVVADGEWHVMVVDLSAIETFTPSDDGSYSAKHLRIDVINQKMDNTFFIDFAYVAMHDDIDYIMEFLGEDEDVTFIGAEVKPDTGLNLFVTPEELDSSLTFYCDKALNEDGSYVRYAGKGKSEAFVYPYMDSTAPIVT